MGEALSWLKRRGNWESREIGAVKTLKAENIIKALRLARTGQVYDLGLTRFPDMPVPSMHPGFKVLSYRTPRGLAVDRDVPFLRVQENSADMAFQTEFIMGSVHTGTHIDALSHITIGADRHWHGGFTFDADSGEFGPHKSDGAKIPPLICRGLLLDVAAARQEPALARGYGITVDDLKRAAEDLTIEHGDVVLVRTGYLSLWPEEKSLREHAGAGLTPEAATWLAEQGVVAVGSDTEAVEQLPSSDPSNPHPVHTLFLVERGIYMFELLDLELLSADEVRSFSFIALPVKMSQATAAFVDPVAII